MADTALVTEDVERARRLIEFLDRNEMPVRAGLWMYNSEADRWRFIVSFREQRKDITTFYLDVAKLIDAHGKDQDLLPLYNVSIVDGAQPLIASLSKEIRVDGLGNVRFSHNVINGVYLEDALIMRLSA